jgi:hypothetical protein
VNKEMKTSLRGNLNLSEASHELDSFNTDSLVDYSCFNPIDAMRLQL